MSPTIIFSIITAVVTVGSVLIAIGVLKGRIAQNTEVGKSNSDQMKTLASKDDLAAAIRRSDEMLEMMRKRAEEDRSKGQGQWREFHEALSKHDARIGKLETQQDTIMKSLDELKVDIKSGFKEMQNELKELRKLH